VERTVIAEGALHEISCAVLKDGSSPADETLQLMEQGHWPEDPDVDAEKLPDDAQILDYDMFLSGMEYFATHGVPHTSKVGMNALRDGVWEFKVKRKRFSFFDTDGVGAKFSPRKFTNRDDADDPEDDDFWHVPNFEEKIRIGHCFPKLQDQTTEQQIRRTLQVRWEDLQHDR
jgi:hypothetical protein